MKAIVIYERGGPEKLVYTEVPVPAVKPGWSLVKVRGFGINHSEVFTRQGLSPSVTFPRIPGIECVGEIAETSDPARLKEGQKVISIMGEMGRDFDGGYAEYVLLPNDQIYPVETELPWERLAAIPETFYTAYGSMKNLRIEDGQSVLVRGASSGVGIAFVKLVKGSFSNVRMVGSTRSLKKGEILRSAGFDDIIEERNGELQTEACFDRVLELIGPATLRDTCRHTSEGGIVCSTGQLGGKWYMDGFEPIMELPANGYLTSFYSGNVTAKRIQEMLDYIAEWGIDTSPERVFSLSEVPKAHALIESGESLGKIVVLV